jgi:hypothetical protein
MPATSARSAIEFCVLSDGSRQLGLDDGPLATGHDTAPQLGPQLLNVVVKRDAGVAA